MIFIIFIILLIICLFQEEFISLVNYEIIGGYNHNKHQLNQSNTNIYLEHNSNKMQLKQLTRNQIHKLYLPKIEIDNVAKDM